MLERKAFMGKKVEEIPVYTFRQQLDFKKCKKIYRIHFLT